LEATSLARSLAQELLITPLSLLIMCGLVDGLEHNLLSISQSCDNGYDVMFGKTNCTVINNDNKSIMFKGKRVENVYKINFSELVDQKVICLLSMNYKKWCHTPIFDLRHH